MAKAILEFSFPDDAWEHRQALLGQVYRAILAEMLENLRQKRKHGDYPVPARMLLEEIWQELHDALEGNRVSGEFQ